MAQTNRFGEILGEFFGNGSGWLFNFGIGRVGYRRGVINYCQTSQKKNH